MQNIQAMDMKRFVTILCVMILFVPSTVYSDNQTSTVISESSTESTPTSLSASTADSSTHAATTQSFEEIPVGGHCTEYQDNCTRGAVCEDDTCKLELGEICAGANQSLCKNGTTCDENICKLELGEICAGANQSLCRNGTTCDKNICKISVGGNCTDYQDNCTSGSVCEDDICKLQLGENCAGDKEKLCKNGTTCDKDICKISVGGNCTDYDGDCTNGTVCEDNTCRIIINGNCSGVNQGYCRNDTTCDIDDKCKVIYGKNCSSNDACIHSLNCTSIENTTLCLCPDKQFRYNDSCENVTNLSVNFSQGSNSYTENEVSVNWTRPPYFTELDITYCVNISLNQSYDNCTNNTSITFSNRTPGTMYLITITTQVPKDSSLNSGYEETVSESKQYYTKPAIPGNLTENEYAGPDVDLHFTSSNGGVQLYVITVSNNTYNYTLNTTSSSDPNVSITGLIQGTYYNFIAFARITRNDRTENIDSDILSTKFHVKANESDPVKDLKIEGNSSRWAVISWLRPANPRGEIVGYALYAESGETCVLAFLSKCTNCSKDFEKESKTCNRTESKNYTREQFQSDTLNFTVNATELNPAVRYTMTVFAHNIAGKGKPNNVTITTDEEAAQDISSVKISALEEKMLNVTWTPGEYTGNTTYCVTWAEETSLGSNNYLQKNNTNISGYENLSMTIDGLLSFWNYNVTVQAFTAKGFSPNARSASYRTKDSQPGEVRDFEIIQPEKSAQKLDLIVQCPEECDRNGNITSYSVTYSIIGTENSSIVNKSSDTYCSNNVSISIDVTAEKNYSISVSANTVRWTGIPKNKTKYIEPKEPELTNPPDGFPGFVAFDKNNTNNTDVSVIVQLCTCLVDEKQGAITLAGIIICKMVNLKDCEPEKGKNETYYKATNLTWAYYNKNTNTKKYRTTPDTFHKTIKNSARRRRRSLSEPLVMNYAVGNDSSCDSTHQDEFCNGRLKPSTQYKAIAFACTLGGCSESQAIGIETKATPTTEPDVGAIVGGIFGALAAIAIIVLVIFLYRRYQRKDDFVEIDAPHKTIVRKPVKLKHFAEHLERLHRDSNLLFQEEFEEVQENSPKNYSNDAATLDANKVKNRYVNILSFDHTRVKLITDDGDPSTDFINANYIPGYSSPREYIATQGPMVSTVPDMWRMMWEQNSSIIVMLSDLTEKGRPKVDMYWPNELNSPVQYGNVIVDMTACSTLNTYTIRNFTISMENGNEKRRVTQYFFPGWEDYGANVSPEDLLDFVKAVRQEATSKPDHGPITVHCSAGVGRTGTFIALDFLMQFVNDNSLDAEVDIYNLVLNMRHHRPMMVQSEKQYIFVHDALKLIIENKIKAMKEQNEDNIYQNTTLDNIYANQAFEPEDENLYENTNKLGQPTTTL